MANMEKELRHIASAPIEDIHTSEPGKSKHKVVEYPQATAATDHRKEEIRKLLAQAFWASVIRSDMRAYMKESSDAAEKMGDPKA